MGHSSDTVPAQAPLERRIAVIAAGCAVSDDAIDLVTEALGDADPLVRSSALGAALRQGRLSGDMVARALADPIPLVRQRAAQLAPVASGAGTRSTLPEALIAALADPVPLCVVTVLEALAARHIAACLDEVITLAMSARDPLVVEEAVATLASLGDERGLPAVLAATVGRPALRRRSVAALGAFEGDVVEDTLDRLAQDRDWQVRQAVAMLRREPLDALPEDFDDEGDPDA